MLKRPSIILGSPEARLTIWSLEPDTAATATIKMMNIFMVELIRGKEVDGGGVKRGGLYTGFGLCDQMVIPFFRRKSLSVFVSYVLNAKYSFV